MCEQCGEGSGATMGNRRRRLGEIDGHWYCTIIGTCLGLADLRALKVKLRLELPPGAEGDYALHAAFVRLIGQQRLVAKLVHKLLDRRHGLAIKAFAAATDAAAVEAKWQAALRNGEVAGAYWAAITHPATTPALSERIFGDVHMLSHLVGAANRADVRRLGALEQENAQLAAAAAERQARLRATLAERDRDLAALRAELAARPDTMPPPEADDTRALRTALAATRERAAGLEDRAGRLERRLRDDATALAAAIAARAAGEAECRQLRQENRLLEDRLAALLDSAAGCGAGCHDLDLCGRSILYVGGPQQQAGHLRGLVERCNGALLHHDGGLEDGLTRLDHLLGRADAVLFPVDCVSHEASRHIKRQCRRLAKPYVPLRSSGLGSLTRGLAALTRPATAAVRGGCVA